MKTDFDEYISKQPEKTQIALKELRAIILSVVPGATELINYNIPAFALVKGGKRDKQIMIAGYQNHVGFYPNPSVIEKFKDNLIDYKFAKGSVQFPLNKPLPKELIIKMVKYRLAEINS
jgi:uncharacterized protein YdhG (YjbR/CyaY superfamily)